MKDGKETKAPKQKKKPSFEDRAKEIQKQKQLNKTDPILKNLMEEDRKIQGKMLDTSTKSKDKNREVKDW
jgi:hypothetical protein